MTLVILWGLAIGWNNQITFQFSDLFNSEQECLEAAANAMKMSIKPDQAHCVKIVRQ